MWKQFAVSKKFPIVLFQLFATGITRQYYFQHQKVWQSTKSWSVGKSYCPFVPSHTIKRFKCVCSYFGLCILLPIYSFLIFHWLKCLDLKVFCRILILRTYAFDVSKLIFEISFQVNIAFDDFQIILEMILVICACRYFVPRSTVSSYPINRHLRNN